MGGLADTCVSGYACVHVCERCLSIALHSSQSEVTCMQHEHLSYPIVDPVMALKGLMDILLHVRDKLCLVIWSDAF